MNKDRTEGKAKDIAGRVQRQAGEWTGNAETETKGTAKQAEGKVQNAWGKVKDAVRRPARPEHDSETSETETEEEESIQRRRAG